MPSLVYDVDWHKIAWKLYMPYSIWQSLSTLADLSWYAKIRISCSKLSEKDASKKSKEDNGYVSRSKRVSTGDINNKWKPKTKRLFSKLPILQPKSYQLKSASLKTSAVSKAWSDLQKSRLTFGFVGISRSPFISRCCQYSSRHIESIKPKMLKSNSKEFEWLWWPSLVGGWGDYIAEIGSR